MQNQSALVAIAISVLVASAASARIITENSSAPGFPQDPAFAGRSLVLPQPGALLPGPGLHSFTVTVGGVEFTFSSEGYLSDCWSHALCSDWAHPLNVTISPPVDAAGVIHAARECGGEDTFVGSLATETGVGNDFVGAADIGPIKSILFKDACWDNPPMLALWFAPAAGDADLMAHKTANQSRIGAGQSLSYEIAVQNRSNAVASNVEILDLLPPGTRVEGASGAPDLQPPGAPVLVRWSLGDLVGSADLRLSLTTPPFGDQFACEDRLVNVAQVSSSTGESDLANNLSFTSTPFDKTSRRGQSETCGNGLDDDCNGFADFNDAAAACPEPSAITGDVPQDVDTGERPPAPGRGADVCRNRLGEVQAPCCCANHRAGMCWTCRPIDPNAKESDPPTNVLGYGRASAGQTIRYTIHYENVGTVDAHGVTVVDPVHPSLDERTLQIDNGGWFDDAGRTVLWRDPAALPPHQPRSVSFSASIRADAQPGTRVRNRATIIFPEAAQQRTDTNFVEHTILFPGAPAVPDLLVAGCHSTTPPAKEWRVTLVNQGFDFAFNARAEIVAAPRQVHVIDAVAHFAHPDDPNPDILATIMPLSTQISSDTVAFVGERKRDADGDDGGDEDRERAAFDPCALLTWRITYEDAEGKRLSRDVAPSIPRVCPCAGPVSGGTWTDHAGYAACVEKAAREFHSAGLISEKERKSIVGAAEQSSCGDAPATAKRQTSSAARSTAQGSIDPGVRTPQ